MFAKNKHIQNDFKFTSSKNKILIVNDTPDTDVLYKTLELEGYDLFVANHSRMAIDVAPRINPDLIFLDIKSAVKKSFAE